MQNMPHSATILIISGTKGDTRRYRAFHLYQQLRMAGGSVTMRNISDTDVIKTASSCDLLILHRVTFTSIVKRIIDSVHQRGGLVLADEDDLIFDTAAFQWIDSPDFKDSIRAKLYQTEMKLQQETLLACDGVITSTDYLAKVVANYKKPVWVHRNAANLEMVDISSRAIHQKRQPDNKYVIGYASGTLTHNRDFASISPALLDTMNSIPQAELWIIGYLDLPPDFDPVKDRIRRIKPVPWRQLPFWLSQFDMNLAPLVLDNPFSQSKSEIKFMEAALVGVPTVASPTDAFQYAIQHHQNGMLAHNLSDWQDYLQFLSKPEQREILALNAAKSIPQYSPQKRAQQAAQLINKVLEYFGHSERIPVPETIDIGNRLYYWPKLWEIRPTGFELGLYSLRVRGISILLKQIWITLRRLLARWIPY